MSDTMKTPDRLPMSIGLSGGWWQVLSILVHTWCTSQKRFHTVKAPERSAATDSDKRVKLSLSEYLSCCSLCWILSSLDSDWNALLRRASVCMVCTSWPYPSTEPFSSVGLIRAYWCVYFSAHCVKGTPWIPWLIVSIPDFPLRTLPVALCFPSFLHLL